MADEWIKMRVSLLTDHRVVRLAEMLGADDPDLIVGKLFRLWVHADQHTTDGTMFTATMRTVDNLLGYPGFAAALQRIGWLETRPECVVIPRFAEHNGESAKRRCQERRRKKNQRIRQSERDILRTKSGHDAPQEERKENTEERRENRPSPQECPPAGGGGEVAFRESPDEAKPAAADVMAAWNAAAARAGWTPCRDMGAQRRASHRARLRDPFWLAHWREALAAAEKLAWLRGENRRQWVADIDWFLRPRTVARLLEGHYGDRPGAGATKPAGRTLAEKLREEQCRRNGRAGPSGTAPSSG